MKTTIFTLATILSLQLNILFAGNNETRTSVNNETVSLTISKMAPVIPNEATFEDATLANPESFDFSKLVPQVPSEADFSEIVPEKHIDLSILAPVVPAEADFNDGDDQSIDYKALAPYIPAEADFDQPS